MVIVFNATCNNISVISWRSYIVAELYRGRVISWQSYIVAVSFIGGGKRRT